MYCMIMINGYIIFDIFLFIVVKIKLFYIIYIDYKYYRLYIVKYEVKYEKNKIFLI